MPVVNGHSEACAALAAGAVDLDSPAYAACHAGVNYYHALLEDLRHAFPHIPFTFTLCCGDNPAIAHDALRMGFKAVRICCSEGIALQLREIAAHYGAQLLHSNAGETKNERII